MERYYRTKASLIGRLAELENSDAGKNPIAGHAANQIGRGARCARQSWPSGRTRVRGHQTIDADHHG